MTQYEPINGLSLAEMAKDRISLDFDDQGSLEDYYRGDFPCVVMIETDQYGMSTKKMQKKAYAEALCREIEWLKREMMK